MESTLPRQLACLVPDGRLFSWRRYTPQILESIKQSSHRFVARKSGTTLARAHGSACDDPGRFPAPQLGSKESTRALHAPSASHPEYIPLVIPSVISEQHASQYESGWQQYCGFEGRVPNPSRIEIASQTDSPQLPVEEAPWDLKVSAHKLGAPQASAVPSSPEQRPEAETALPDSVQHRDQQRQASRWPVLVLLPAAIWGVTWPLSVGVLSIGYAALASAAAIAASAFSSLALRVVVAPGGGYNGAVAATSSVAAVDWVDVALRTATGLSSDGSVAGHAQILAALQEAGSGFWQAWAVQVLLPGLCSLANGCRVVAVAVRTGLPWLEALMHLTVAAAGLGVLLLLALPLRRYLAPLVPGVPRERPAEETWASLRVGGAACMIAILTTLQMRDISAPLLAASVHGKVVAAAAAVPQLLQTQAVLYGMAAALSDAVLPASTAVVAARIVHQIMHRADGKAELQRPQHVAAVAAGGLGRNPAFAAVRALAAVRLVLDMALLVAVVAGVLPGKISAVRLLGMLWLLQTTAQVL